MVFQLVFPQIRYTREMERFEHVAQVCEGTTNFWV